MGSNVTYDAVIVGINVRNLRETRGWSQQELAERSGIARTTICRIELGGFCHRSTLARVAAAFGPGTSVDLLIHSRRFLNILDRHRAVVKHDGQTVEWVAFNDGRTAVPHENYRLIQTAEERKRLGRMGLVPMFGTSLGFFLPQGLEIMRVEVHSYCEQIFMPHLPVQVVYGLVGTVLVEVNGEVIHLRPGDAVGFQSPSLIGLGSLQEVGVDDVPVVLVVGTVSSTEDSTSLIDDSSRVTSSIA